MADVGWFQWATLGIAMVGAALGVLNTWRTFRQDRLAVDVKTMVTVLLPARTSVLAVRVTNKSNFAVTVDAIGFTMLGTDRHLQIVRPQLSSGDQLPKRLEPRAAFTAFAAPGATEEEPGFAHADRTYATLASGETVFGGTGELTLALAQLARAR